MENDKDQAKNQAKSQINCICDMMKALKTAQKKGEAVYEGEMVDEEGMTKIIRQNALSVQIRSDWQTSGRPLTPTKFKLLLYASGPTVRIIGGLTECNPADEYPEPEDPQVQYRDGFTHWMDYKETTPEQARLILEYCRNYHFDGGE